MKINIEENQEEILFEIHVKSLGGGINSLRAQCKKHVKSFTKLKKLSYFRFCFFRKDSNIDK